MPLTWLFSIPFAFAPPASTREPAPAVAEDQPRDTARSHESRWAFGAAGLLHSAKRGRSSLLQNPDPGLALTTELRLVRGENSQLWLGAEGAWWRAEHIGRTIALRAQFGYRLILGMGLGFEMYGGPGLAFHRFEDDFVPCGCGASDPPRRGLLGGLGVGLLYDFGQVSRVPIAVYGRYEAFVERPLGASEFYLVPHQAVHFGVRLTMPGRRAVAGRSE